MTEEDARAWLAERFGVEAMAKLELFVATVRTEATVQNLIAPSTLDAIWNRHVLDSAQLVPLASATGNWLDIGTGAGFPGMVVAILRPQPTLLVEPRRLRVEFLETVVAKLGLAHVKVIASKVEAVRGEMGVISARAVAPIEKLLRAASGCATTATRWLLPRGRGAADDLAAFRGGWEGTFHVEHSLTDPDSSIVILDGVRARGTAR